MVVIIQFSMLLFCRSRIALVSLCKVRGLMVFLPSLKFMIADLAIPDWRERRLLGNSLLAFGFDRDTLDRPLFRTRGKSRPPGPQLPLRASLTGQRRLPRA
jgi:hypothetical protein